MRTLAAFTADLLSERGALVEPGDHGVEALLPPEAASLLEAPEHLKLSFSREEEGIPVSFDSDFFKKLPRLLADRGRFSSAGLPSPTLRPEKLEDNLEEKVVLHNAVFHLERKEHKRISYLLAYFRYTASSDDRQEGIVASLINEFNLSVSRTRAEILECTAVNAEEPLGQAERENTDQVLRTLLYAQQAILTETLGDFLLSLERRLNRDIRRVYDYYRTLTREHLQALEKKAWTEAEREKIQSRIEAIERELKGKVQDLIGKYQLNLQVDPISFVRFETVTQVFWLLIKRRKGTRSFPLTYNPILRSLDSLPCEVCSYPKGGHSVCDDRLHIICKQCFGPCSQCGKTYCSACQPKGCPRCRGNRAV